MSALFDKHDTAAHEADLAEKRAVAETHTDTRMSAEDAFRTGSQNSLVLLRLEKGPATNVELEEVSGSHRINSRVADVRRWLKENRNQTIVSRCVDSERGVYEYEIV